MNRRATRRHPPHFSTALYSEAATSFREGFMACSEGHYGPEWIWRNHLEYQPAPIDTSGVTLTGDVLELTELLAKNAHDIWAQQRLAEGWRKGPRRDDVRKESPCLIPYDQLPESEKQYDRQAALGTIRAILALGYKIEQK